MDANSAKPDAEQALRPRRIKKGTAEEVRNYWEAQAKTFKKSQLSTDPNKHGRRS